MGVKTRVKPKTAYNAKQEGLETMNREQIKELALTNGFKLKTQPDGSEDLNPYVYDFAAALQAEAVERAIPPFLDPTTNNGDFRRDSEFRMGWNSCRDALAHEVMQLRQQAKEVQP